MLPITLHKLHLDWDTISGSRVPSLMPGQSSQEGSVVFTLRAIVGAAAATSRNRGRTPVEGPPAAVPGVSPAPAPDALPPLPLPLEQLAERCKRLHDDAAGFSEADLAAAGLDGMAGYNGDFDLETELGRQIEVEEEEDAWVTAAELRAIAAAVKSGRMTDADWEAEAERLVKASSGVIAFPDLVDADAGLTALLTSTVKPRVGHAMLPQRLPSELFAHWSTQALANVGVLRRRADDMSRPLGGDSYPGNVREVSLLLETTADGGRSTQYVYWQHKQLDARIGRAVRLDEAGRFIYDVTVASKSWLASEVLLSGVRATMTKGDRTAPAGWVSTLKLMVDIALDNSHGSDGTEGASHDSFAPCGICAQKTGDELVFTCALCLCSWHTSCTLKVFEACAEELLKLPTPLPGIGPLPSPFADMLHEPRCSYREKHEHGCKLKVI